MDYCQNCGYPLSPSEERCSYCGTAASRQCTNCFAPVALGLTACPRCGTAVSMTGAGFASPPPLHPPAMQGSSGPPAGQFAPPSGAGPPQGHGPPASAYATQSAPVQAI
ncbi:MAG TPA: zinc ribbon domain-containing protein, partial [Thermoplasmata archaeon]|nr:zinc ribbon domain-containing protein [Thermoplasmata archaeon]